MAELAGGEVLVEIALYNPASATTVSSISTTLFIGGVSFARTSARGEVYAQSMLCEHHDLWIIRVFEDPCAVNCCGGCREIVWPRKSYWGDGQVKESRRAAISEERLSKKSR